jgi:PAS domain S-box-containing protein
VLVGASAFLAVRVAECRGALPGHGVALGVRVSDAVAVLAVFALGRLVVSAARQARETATARRVLRLLLDLAADGTLLMEEGSIVCAAGPDGKVLGHDQGTLTGRPLSVLLPGVTATGALRGEFTGRRCDGREVALEVRSGSVPGGKSGCLTAFVLRDVTANRQVREAIQTRDVHLRLVVEQMPAILWTTDAQLRITSTQGRGLEAVNLQPAEVVGASMLECLGQQSVEDTPIAAHMRALRGESLSYEMEWKGRHFQVRVDPLYNLLKKVTGTIGLLVDVTEHKAALAEVQTRARQQAAVAQLGQRGLEGVDPGPLLAEAAALTADTLGAEFCAALELGPSGRSIALRGVAGWTSLDTRALPAGVLAHIRHTLQSGRPVITEDLTADGRFSGAGAAREDGVAGGMTAIIHGKGRPFGVLGVYTARCRRFSDDDLHFLQAVANVLATSVQRKRAEEGQGRLVAILEATTDLVAIISVEGRLQYLNHAGRGMLGLGPGEDVSRCLLSDFFGEAGQKLLAGVVVPAALGGGTWNGEATLRGRGGRETPVSLLVLAHRSPAGAIEFLSAIARDVGERQQLEAQLRQAQKMEAIGRLAGGVAHDFNNMLTVIIGNAQLMRGEPAVPGELDSYLEAIIGAGERAALLTRQLLAFGRKQILAPRPLDLTELVRDMEPILRRLLGEDIEMVTELAPHLPPVTADAGQLQQIVMNLVVNSRDAMPRGGRLTLATGREERSGSVRGADPELPPGEYVVLTVADTGCGMGPEVLAHLFEPFFTTKEMGKGTGLGLATVYGIVQQSGGDIRVRSEPGRGTRFDVYLPQALGVDGLAETCPALAGLADSSPLGFGTVLLVEDEADVRALARHVLQRSGYRVLEASSGEEALVIAAAHPGPIDLLLTDVVMPQMSGTELFHGLAPLRPDMRVLFMSGFNESALLRHGVVSGTVDCLLKPFSPAELARAVREALDRPVISGLAISGGVMG